MSMSLEQIKDSEGKFKKVVELYREELKNIRTGRVNSSMVDGITIDYYGTKTPLKQAASISSQDARTIVVTPWSKDTLAEIEKAIKESDLGVNPVNDGTIIRLSFPALTEERRGELVKMMGKKTEEARIKIRQIREEAWDGIQKKEKEGDISEDDKFRGKEELQKVVDEYNKRIEEINNKKEEEIRQV